MESLIKLENVWKKYKLGKTEVPVLRGISLDIKPGSFATIMGPSGSGKSTLMYLLGLLDTPSEGKIYMQGQDVSGFSEDKLAQLRGEKIGFIFQQFNLLQNLTALENVILPMIFQGVPEAERREKAAKLLESVGLAKRINHKPTEMSGGEQQRIAIARSLVNNPEILIADEPTGNLDSTTGKMVMGILTKLHKEDKKTIVVVTHDPNIAHYTQNIIHIQDGQIVANHFKNEEVLWAENGKTN
ncbi:MAG: ABC transporter ATP-binding protein [Candidatus Staskawiczbacteria bacterium RIFOXYC1_FULL_37_43]|nr:MAG: ABC transporter ATP-binding protein [Candidatus Staskawiczbacteria bacterium RIFCSPHIGHO2_01_FULL_37_17]OGZ71257.1 MAG: ABC transporter ATP-binding protein [Candidatus Staskawiczbacteria bacterium RIFCSPLOWO2_01_FULL_37_19]OGZ75603.1 MAG: ABC transporter ATP-binding protein [Candidatus Staskawiczbacteria bacterium RIFOXYA1_FULL_37_15]OGZ76620.1 MAG: ABC transporter ATP-binding protein [Candidatus Staskawiczbacteria bacterium RIFOXYA12_FULL_37_10]OGZ79879.1 MAG: ABC transporter ATP-bindi